VSCCIGKKRAQQDTAGARDGGTCKDACAHCQNRPCGSACQGVSTMASTTTTGGLAPPHSRSPALSLATSGGPPRIGGGAWHQRVVEKERLSPSPSPMPDPVHADNDDLSGIRRRRRRQTLSSDLSAPSPTPYEHLTTRGRGCDGDAVATRRNGASTPDPNDDRLIIGLCYLFWYSAYTATIANFLLDRVMVGYGFFLF
jgi:hypothetical protein